MPLALLGLMVRVVQEGNVAYRVIGALLMFLAASAPARAEIAVAINTQTQLMDVTIDGVATYQWPVSTGAEGYWTPGGSFRPFRLEAEHYSKEWDDAPMPHSIFFTEQGHAIHGTNSVRALGSPVSHGCVRLAPKNAAMLFELVQQHGLNKTKIEIDSGWDFFEAPVETEQRVPDGYARFMRVFGG
jgi:lipoprotein-anchoring transpeptidase ErfK/SrfK